MLPIIQDKFYFHLLITFAYDLVMMGVLSNTQLALLSVIFGRLLLIISSGLFGLARGVKKLVGYRAAHRAAPTN